MSTRKEREEEQRRASILDAAEKLFSERGMNETSIADIARDAEFGVGTLYRYFSDRNNLVESLIADRMHAHFEELNAALSQEQSPPRQLERLVAAWLHSVQQRVRFFRFYYRHFHPTPDCNGGAPGQNPLHDSMKALIEQLDRLFEDGITRGYFAPIENPGHYTVALFGMLMSFYFFAEHHRDGQIEEIAFKESILRIFYDRILLKEDEVSL